MKLSVCIPSYNPELKLSTTLDSLISQKEFINEIVIVIDNDIHEQQVGLLRKKYSTVFNLFVVTQANSGRARARNRAAEIATGDVLFFLDDDMLAESSLVQKHFEYQKANPETIIVGNGYNNPADAKDDFSKYIIKMGLSWQYESEPVQVVSFEKFVFTACNMSISKRLFNKLNGFDDRLKDAEDFDMGIRALKQGVKIIYDRTLTAWHNDWPDIKAFIKRNNEYAKGRKELLDIHPEYVSVFPDMVLASTSIIKKTILSICRVAICPFVISSGFIFNKLPLMFKFKLYKLTISAYASINRW